MTDHTLSHNERLLAFVEHMARMTTPTDEDSVREYCVQNDIAPATPVDEIEEEIISDLPGDTAYDDALAFYAMIRQARELTASDEPAEITQ